MHFLYAAKMLNRNPNEMPVGFLNWAARLKKFGTSKEFNLTWHEWALLFIREAESTVKEKYQAAYK